MRLLGHTEVFSVPVPKLYNANDAEKYPNLLYFAVLPSVVPVASIYFEVVHEVVDRGPQVEQAWTPS